MTEPRTQSGCPDPALVEDNVWDDREAMTPLFFPHPMKMAPEHLGSPVLHRLCWAKKHHHTPSQEVQQE